MTENRPRTIHEALELVLAEARTRRTAIETVPIEEAAGRILAEEISADLDLPPFDKSIVDGYAVRSSDVGTGGASLRVVGEILAGGGIDREIGPGEAVAIMTGAPMPLGADAVVMVEKTRTADGMVSIDTPVKPGQNRLIRGLEFRFGDVLLRPGTRLTPPRLGVVASVGRATVKVSARPRAALVGTGDEIVPIDSIPRPGQIRDSNTTTLKTLLARLGAERPTHLLVPDRFDALRSGFEELVRGNGPEGPIDVLLISGGVSAGVKDLVPSALEAAGVGRIFHKVELKPGKPLWFGVGPASDGHPGTLVFGLPGNPVSGLVCSLLFAAPALEVMSGGVTNGPRIERRPIAIDYSYRQDRPTYHPARLNSEGAVEPLTWGGSADLKTVGDGDGFLFMEPGERRLATGTIVGFLPIP